MALVERSRRGGSFSRSSWAAPSDPLTAIRQAPFLSRMQKRELAKRERPRALTPYHRLVWMGRWAAPGDPAPSAALLMTTHGLGWTYRMFAWMPRGAEAPWTAVSSAVCDIQGLSVTFTNREPLTIAAVADAVAPDAITAPDSLAGLANVITVQQNNAKRRAFSPGRSNHSVKASDASSEGSEGSWLRRPHRNSGRSRRSGSSGWTRYGCGSSRWWPSGLRTLRQSSTGAPP